MLARYQNCSARLLLYLLSTTKYVLWLFAPPLPQQQQQQQQQHKLCSFPLTRPPRLEPPFRAPSTPSLRFVLRTCFLSFPSLPYGPIPLAFISQPSLLSVLFGCQSKKSKILFLQSPIWADFCFLSSFPFTAIINALLPPLKYQLGQIVAASASSLSLVQSPAGAVCQPIFFYFCQFLVNSTKSPSVSCT